MVYGGTFTTALVRAVIGGLVSGATASIGVYATTDDAKPVVVAFVSAFLGCAAVRGLVEGSVDAGRQRSGDVAPADVQPGAAGRP